MLRQITPEQYYEWLAFAEIEPFDEARQDHRVSRLMALLATLKSGRSFSARDFLFKFGDVATPAEGSPSSTKPWQHLKMIAMMHYAASKVKKR